MPENQHSSSNGTIHAETSFLNPYHFFPLPDATTINGFLSRDDATTVLKPGSQQDEPDQQPSEADDGKPAAASSPATGSQSAEPDSRAHALRHDMFGPGLHSGRIICQLETVTPCVFGNEHLAVPSIKGNNGQADLQWGSFVENLRLRRPDGSRSLVPAIAATTLKGAISSVAEATSGSAMRVLNNTPLSYRSATDEVRTAVAMVVEVQGDHGRMQRKLLPLTFPRLQLVEKGAPLTAVNPRISGESSVDWLAFLEEPSRKAWARLSSKCDDAGGQCRLTLPVYLNGYGPEDTDRRPMHQFTQPHGFLASKPTPESHCHSNFGQLWSCHVASVGFTPHDEQGVPGVRWSGGQSVLHFGSRDRNRNYPLTIAAPADLSPTLVSSSDANSIVSNGQDRIGILRRLSPPRDPRGKDRQLKALGSKYHELFIPIDALIDHDSGRIDVDQFETQFLNAEHVCARFDALAAEIGEREKDSRPFRLMGQGQGKLRLRHGDLVHFRLRPLSDEALHDDTVLPEVDSVSISAIWREDAHRVFDYFGGDSDEDGESRNGQPNPLSELLPWSPRRKTISPAEALFGFVDGTGRKAEDEIGELRTLAGRVRFSAAYVDTEADADGNWELTRKQHRVRLPDKYKNCFPLEILSSPRPPCPEMYFQMSADNGKQQRVTREAMRACRPGQVPEPVAGTEEESTEEGGISDVGTLPQLMGRKTWLHQPGASQPDADGWYSWETRSADSANQKSVVRPLKPELQFHFHVDFENLTEDELSLLLFALRPTEEFRHRLGYGKPLGLGSVKISPACVLLVDREERYRNSRKLLAASPDRYSKAWIAMSLYMSNWPDRYRKEQQASLSLLSSSRQCGSVEELHGGVQRRSNCATETIGRAIELLGSLEAVEQFLAEQPESVIDYPRGTRMKRGRPDKSGYVWFQNNRDAHQNEFDPQFLRPITESTESLKELELKANQRTMR